MTTTPDQDRPTGRRLCPHCGGTPGGCEALHTVGGRRCCNTCTGDHNTPEPTR